MPCPFCVDPSDDTKVHWILCDVCEVWCHQKCVNVDNALFIDQFHCPHCEKTHGLSTFKEQRRSRRSSAAKLNYADLNEGTSTGDEKIWGKLLRAKSFAPDKFPRYKAREVNMKLIRKTGLREPFIVKENESELQMKMPPKDITVHQIADLVGGNDYPVDVIDVASQSELSGWTMGRWADYFHSEEKDRIRNVISLEISGSELAEQITRPKIVRELDWTELMWPTDLHPNEFPRVQLYCLMSVKDSYTDFHIDFGGSSVFYHVLRGQKIFYLIEPTQKNLKKYQKWSSSPDQSTIFLGDEVKDCHSVELYAGNTMIIPSGWIHAVFTSRDSIVIGGNFLHSFHVEAQAQVYAIEDITDVPLKFRYPFYKRLNWYALENFNKWLDDQNKRTELSHFELESMFALANFLQTELHKANDSLVTSKNDAISNKNLLIMPSQTLKRKEQIPETVHNPIALIENVRRKAREILNTNTESTASGISSSPNNEKLEITNNNNNIKEVPIVTIRDSDNAAVTPPANDTNEAISQSIGITARTEMDNDDVTKLSTVEDHKPHRVSSMMKLNTRKRKESSAPFVKNASNDTELKTMNQRRKITDNNVTTTVKI
ncbi:hypothetical protein BDF20DRAFT_873250 [Mycotypha africana]|uniref:uncharacterized protein n=1 Tax=Mycotypha africana TaxID=64632 RepID=UPI00230063FD|nr:uncharacterized protein BDF20DRAFT_873250 [Mycotypha africana]KAI8977144.1 hypothetical protein BDF20DRAFT_873250 [Mycotypha africana]